MGGCTSQTVTISHLRRPCLAFTDLLNFNSSFSFFKPSSSEHQLPSPYKAQRDMGARTESLPVLRRRPQASPNVILDYHSPTQSTYVRCDNPLTTTSGCGGFLRGHSPAALLERSQGSWAHQGCCTPLMPLRCELRTGNTGQQAF